MKKTTSMKIISGSKTLQGRQKMITSDNIGELSGNSAHESAPPNHDQIAAMAYKLWCERGGTELENWLEAERRLQQQPCE